MDLPDIRALLADTSLSTWFGVALLVVGGYMIVSWFVPGISIVGNLVLLGAGIVLLAQHLQRGRGAWALYAGAVLTGLGAARLAGDLLPGDQGGLTALGIGVAFLAIGYLRHSQAGGYGWQGVVGALFAGLGVIQLVLGALPGTPGILDLIVPALLIGAGALLVLRTRSASRPAR